MKAFAYSLRKLWLMLSLLILAAIFVLAAFQFNEMKVLALTKQTTPMNASYDLIDQPMPSTDFSPHDVVEIQLKALQQNNTQDNGIEIIFNFASPDNKALTGPLNHFKQIVKEPLYEPMLNFQSLRAAEMVEEGEQAEQVILITDKYGDLAAFLFTLSKQTQAPYQNCWMTDSVMRIEMKRRLEI
ncbi:MAG: DUF4864 domain-containing protein [Bacteroidota bacterium]